MADEKKGIRFSFEDDAKRLEELEALVRKKKQAISKSRRATETKLKIILGAYFFSDKKRLEGLFHDKGFQAFLSEKDKDFVRAAVKSLVNGEASPSAETKRQASGDAAKAPAYIEKMGGDVKPD